MANTDPNAVRFPLEARADFSHLIAELRIAADAAAVSLETAHILLGRPGELVSVFTHLQALADGAAELSSRWYDLMAAIYAPGMEAGR